MALGPSIGFRDTVFALQGLLLTIVRAIPRPGRPVFVSTRSSSPRLEDTNRPLGEEVRLALKLQDEWILLL